MRSAALCLLAISASGCNSLLKLDETLLVDAGPGAPTDGPLPTARLTYMVVATMGAMPAPEAEFPPISPAPMVKTGRIGGPLTDAEIDDAGLVRVPYDYETTAWRLVFQLASDIPHEVQWTPIAGRVPHFIVPIYGRLDRAPIPGPGTELALTSTGVNAPTQHRRPRIFTTGVWTESLPVGLPPAGPTFTANFNQSLQLSKPPGAPPGAPERAKGDFVLLSDFNVTADCRVSDSSARFDVDLTTGTSMTISNEPWARTPKTTIVSGDEIPARARAGATAFPNAPVTGVVQAGAMPSSLLPGFTQRVSGLGLRAPLMLTMAECTNAVLPQYNMPTALVDFPYAAHMQLFATRTASGGATLTSGLAAVKPIMLDAAAFDFNIAIPSAPFMFGGASIDATDGAPLAAGTGPLMLMFASEPGMAAPDYYDVILHRISGSSAIPERIYTFTRPPLTVDRDVLMTGGEYVFEIRAYVGATDVDAADYTRYAADQTMAVAWTHTFVAP